MGRNDKKEINTFFKGNTSINWNERYSNNISPFQKLVLEELTKEFKSRMIDFLSSPEFEHLWFIMEDLLARRLWRKL